MRGDHSVKATGQEETEQGAWARGLGPTTGQEDRAYGLIKKAGQGGRAGKPGKALDQGDHLIIRTATASCEITNDPDIAGSPTASILDKQDHFAGSG